MMATSFNMQQQQPFSQQMPGSSGGSATGGAGAGSGGGGSEFAGSGGGGGGGNGGGAVLLQNERQVVRKAGRQAIRQFLEQHNCFSVLRASGKVVVFDTRIPVQLAFYALVEHDMLAAPLWEPVMCQFVGLFTVTDFIDILRHYQATGKDVSALATNSIAEIVSASVNGGGAGGGPASDGGGGGGANKASADANSSNNADVKPFKIRPFHGADSSCTLKQACKLLLKSGDNVDFLPIVFADDMRVLACLSYTNILEHLVTHFREQRRLFDDSIADLGIGTWAENANIPDQPDDGGEGYGGTLKKTKRKLITVHQNQTLAQALELMQVHSLSALPVLDDNNRIYSVYSRSDITFLTRATDAEDAVRNLDMTLIEVLGPGHQNSQASQQQGGQAPGSGPAPLLQPSPHDVMTTPDALRTCSPSHTLQAIFESFSQLRFNRLYVVDEENHLMGVVSAKDLVAYFLMDDDDDDNLQNNATDNYDSQD